MISMLLFHVRCVLHGHFVPHTLTLLVGPTLTAPYSCVFMYEYAITCCERQCQD